MVSVWFGSATNWDTDHKLGLQSGKRCCACGVCAAKSSIDRQPLKCHILISININRYIRTYRDTAGHTHTHMHTHTDGGRESERERDRERATERDGERGGVEGEIHFQRKSAKHDHAKPKEVSGHQGLSTRLIRLCFLFLGVGVRFRN